ncbi:hypothetical protein K2173_002621 [Erythroxylum novogranatense]|uniref:Uncharacterized protein n=1 Tax=Erythroxylum novogranatense TaxID=1862640 RepID=A0AAV8SWK8_9ROSI|nr:hypothetical protein K2173_002621 [Erythroxylum novogranatense]
MEVSENHDSKELNVPNGDDVEEEKEAGSSNGVVSPKAEVDQEQERVTMRHVESKEDMFEDATDDMQENQFHETENVAQIDTVSVDKMRELLEKTVAEKESVVREFKEERDVSLREVANLHRLLKGLNDNGAGEGEEMVADSSIRELIGECSQLVKAVWEEKLRSESEIRELREQNGDLNGRVQLDQNVDAVADRILGSLGAVVNLGELVDNSVMGKITHVERSISVLVEQYSWMFQELDQLRQCLIEGGLKEGVQEEFGPWMVFAAARNELVELKKKEIEMMEKLNHLESDNRTFMEEVQKERAMVETANAELEQEKKRCAITKEKLSMAVTKGKALVQHRDSLKQSLAEKTTELENCWAELQEKSKAIEASEAWKEELVKHENLVVSLQEMLSQKNATLQIVEEMISQTSVPEELQTMDIVERFKWLINFVAVLQDMVSQKDATFQELEAIIFEINFPEELKSSDIIEKLKWYLNLVASLQDVLSQRNNILESLDEICSHINGAHELSSMDIVGKLNWLVDQRNALIDELLEFRRLKDALPPLDPHDTTSSLELETQICRLKEAFNQAKGEVNLLQNEISSIKEAAHTEVERLTVLLLGEYQENEYIKEELDSLSSECEKLFKQAHQASSDKDQVIRMLLEGSGIVADSQEGTDQTYSDIATLISRCIGKMKEQNSCSFDTFNHERMFEKMQSLVYVRDLDFRICENLVEEDKLARSEVTRLSDELRMVSQDLLGLKKDKNSLQKDLERSEDKSALLRERLSLAVKKGKGLVQDRDNIKLLLEEKNSEIEKFKLELQEEKSKVAECENQIIRLSTELEKVPRLESDLVELANRRDQLEQFLLERNNMLQAVIESIDRIVLPVDLNFEEPVAKVNWLADNIDEWKQAKNFIEQELDKVKEEASITSTKLLEAQKTIKSLEDELSVAESKISELAEEKCKIELAMRHGEEDLQKAMEEVTVQTSKCTEALANRKSLEDALTVAESNISVLIREREDAQLGRTTTETELEEVRKEAAIQTSKLSEAYRNIKSLEDSLSQAGANITLLTEQNNHVQVGRTHLEDELQKLRDKVDSQDDKLAEASTTIRTQEDELSKAASSISVLEDEKRITEEEIFTLNSKLKALMDELAGSNSSFETKSVELIQHIRDLQNLVNNDNVLPLVRHHFEKEFENLRNMDIIVKDICDHLADTEMLQGHSAVEGDSFVFPNMLGNILNMEGDNFEISSADVGNICLHIKNAAEAFLLKRKYLVDQFEGLFSFVDEIIEVLLRRLRATKDSVLMICEHMESVNQELKHMERHKEQQERIKATLEQDIRVLQLACTSAVGELQFEVKNNLLELSSVPELQKSQDSSSFEATEVGGLDTEYQQSSDECNYLNMVEMLSLTTRKVKSLIKMFESTSNVAAATIEDLQNELRNTIEASANAIEERDVYSNKVTELKSNMEALQDSCKELKLKMEEDYKVLEERLKEKDGEISTLQDNLLLKEHKLEDGLILTSDMKILFDKINGIEIPYTKSEGNVEAHSSVEMKKLFSIVECATEFHHQIKNLSHDKAELQSTVMSNVLEIEHLKEEIEKYIGYTQEFDELKTEMSDLTLGLERIVDKLEGDEVVGRVLPILENKIMALLLEVENSKSQAKELGDKLHGSQKAVDELSTKVNLLEDLLQSRSAQPEIVQERSIFAAPSVASGSEISEIEETGNFGKNEVSSVSSAAHPRTMRKGSNDHLALNVDLESASLLNKEEKDEDKGHVFKSLNTSGLVPKQAKSVADRLDGIWVSGGRVLMSRPRARLGLIAYWLLVHLWLLGTIL